MGAFSNVANQVQAQVDATNQAYFDSLLAGFNIPKVNPNAGIPQQYTQPSQPSQTPGLMQADSLAPMQMYQNRNAYQSQYGTPDSLAPMQMLAQYRQGNPPTTGTAPGPSATGGK